MNEAIKHLEEKIAFLEHHVTEQDRVMLEFSEELSRIKRELKLLTNRPAGSEGGDNADPFAQDERPPHY